MEKKLLIGSLFITTVSILFTLFQILAIKIGWSNGIFVVDAISLKRSLLRYDIIDNGFSSVSQVINQVLSFYTLLVVYFWTGSEFGFFLDFIINLILTILAWKNTVKIAKFEAYVTPNLLIYASIFWFLNPYYLSVMMFPNKEVLLFFLTTACAKNILSGRYLIATLYIMISYFTRDGHGVALLCAFAAYVSITHFRIRGWQVMLSAAIMISLLSINDLALLGGAFERNAYIGSNEFGYSNGPGSNSNKLLSVFVNWLNFAFRPQFFSADGIYLINFGFWLLGILIFLTLPSAYYTIWKSEPKNLFSSLLIFSISAALIVSSYSQQRYFMPFLPFALIMLTNIKPRFVLLIATSSILLYPILDNFGILPPLQTGVSIKNLREIGL